MLDDTIYALSSGSGICAISLIRVSGNKVLHVIDKCFHKSDINPRHSYYATLYDLDNNPLDDVVFVYFKGPNSYTGEDLLEISCHGSPLIRQNIYLLLEKLGLRMANRGEFSQRAVMNNKMSLTQVEGVNDMIYGRTNNAIALGYKASHGQIDDILQPLYDQALQVDAHINVNIDFPEYDDIEVLTNEKILPIVNQLQIQLNKLIEVSKRTINILSGIKVAIVGKPNVGKSSLLNALLHENKAIVTDIEGTTRDIVEGEIVIDDLYIKLLDTAGIRESDSIVEKIGIDKSLQAIDDADCIIMVVSQALGIDDKDQYIMDKCKDKPLIIVNNKTDLIESDKYINISAANNDIDNLINALKDMYAYDLSTINDPTLTNARQLNAALSAYDSLLLVKQQLIEGLTLDLVDVELQNFISLLKEIGGQSYSETVLDRIFSSFCVGK